MRIILVRHGESEANVDRSVLLQRPDHAIGLSDLGKQQAYACGEFLNDSYITLYHNWRTRIWYSPYLRAKQTALNISEKLTKMSSAIVDMREHILLCEQQFGLFDGHPEEDLPRLFPVEHEHYRKHEEFEGRFWARMPLGESRFDVAQRVHQAFGTFHRDNERHGINQLIIVCHGVTLRAFVMMWSHKDVEWFEKERNPGNCAVRLIAEGEDLGYVFGGPKGV